MRFRALLIAAVVLTTTLVTAQTATQIWDDLIAGNQRFIAGHPQSRDLPATRKSLADHQSPKVIVLGCADSRVAPELLFDKNLGDLFVVRVAGNRSDRFATGSMEYAVEHLHSAVLVILGHTSCGAVAAACGGGHAPEGDLGALVRDIAPSCQKPSGSKESAALKSIEQNVRDSKTELLSHSKVLAEAVNEGKLTIIEAVYDLNTGEVRKLK